MQLNISMNKDFFKKETAPSLVLAIAALLALVIKNSPLKDWYLSLLHMPVIIQIGSFMLDKTLLLFINDGLMVLFFLLITLEMKREYLKGELSSAAKIRFPLIAAIGGMIFPIAYYLMFNYEHPENYRGWAIPAATDIAFSLGLVAALGKNVPKNLRLCLLGIAVFDDLAIIAIIAIFYVKGLCLTALAIAGVFLATLAYLNYKKSTSLAMYLCVGFFLWLALLKSGVHATLAGVLIALAMPCSPEPSSELLAEPLERKLHYAVAFGIVPIFAFANAGVDLRGFSLADLHHPITGGIISGLFFGKPLGVFVAGYLGVFSGQARLPRNVSWAEFYGVSTLTGIGFTMSLFIAMLAFNDADSREHARLGILIGSLLSAVFGAIFLERLSKYHHLFNKERQ